MPLSLNMAKVLGALKGGNRPADAGVDVDEAVVADGVDGAEVDAGALEAVERDADGVAGCDDRGAVGPGRGVGAVGLDAVPGDGAEAAVLRGGGRVLDAADGRLEGGQGRVGGAGRAGVLVPPTPVKVWRRRARDRVALRQVGVEHAGLAVDGDRQ